MACHSHGWQAISCHAMAYHILPWYALPCLGKHLPSLHCATRPMEALQAMRMLGKVFPRPAWVRFNGGAFAGLCATVCARPAMPQRCDGFRPFIAPPFLFTRFCVSNSLSFYAFQRNSPFNSFHRMNSTAQIFVSISGVLIPVSEIANYDLK